MTAPSTVESAHLIVPPLPRAAPRSWEKGYVRSVLVLDAIASGLAGIVGFFVAVSWYEPATLAYIVQASLTPMLWLTCIGLAGGYETRFLGSGPEEFRRVALGAFGLMAAVGMVTWAADAEVARSFVLAALPTAVVLTPIGRLLARSYVRRRREEGEFLRRTVIVGSASAVDVLAHTLRTPACGYRVLGACVPDEEGEVWSVTTIPVLGTFSSIVDVVSRTEADTVAVVASHYTDAGALRRLAWELEPTGATLVVAPSLMEVAGPRMSVRPIGGLPLLQVDHPKFTGFRRLLKGVYDRALAVAALVALAPLLMAVAVAVKIDSPGPVLFRQTRVGELGRPFTILKFRTMSPDAEARKDEVHHLNEAGGPLFKAKSDPRVTRVGAFLRRTSLDELPQLINVLGGSMSLVGPRPHLPSELALFGEDFCRRLFVKPGLTGLWQVSGRSDLTWEESVRLDLRYVENWTLTWDIYIMWRTLSVVLKRAGAY